MTAWEIAFLPLPDGASLRWGAWSCATPKGVVLLLPGRGEFIEKYTGIAQQWAARGYHSLCLDWRGQGGSQTQGFVSFETQIADLGVFWKTVFLPRVIGQTLVMAHSTGAHLALRFFGETGAQVDGLIVSAPLVRPGTFGVPYPIARVVTALVSFFVPNAHALGQSREPKFEGNRLTSDEENYMAWQALRQAYPKLTTEGARWGWVNAAMKAESKLRAALPHVQPPVLALLTPNDPIVDGHAEEALPRLLPRCSTLYLPTSRHEVLMECAEIRAQVWSAIDAFIVTVSPTASN